MLVLFCLDPLLHAILSLLRFANYSDLRLFASFLTVSSLATFACFSCHISLVALRFVLARAACAVRAAHIMPQDNTVHTQIVGGITYNWVSVPNQRAISGFSWTSPSVVSAAGFSTVVPPLSGFPQDVGWPIWGAGLRIVYSHDGPFGIYGTRIFVPFPADSNQNRPIVVQNYDTPEQTLLTSLLSAAGRWTDTLPQKSKYDHGNWWLLRMFGTYCGRADFGYDRKSNLGNETFRAVAAVSLAFHHVFGAIRC